MKIKGIETFRTANEKYNLSMPIGIYFDDSDSELKDRIEKQIKNGDKIYFVSPNDERMKSAQKLIEEL